jgi:hypothetical protein
VGNVRLSDVRARAAVWICIAAGSLLARQPSVTLADFDGPNPLAGWTVSSNPDNRDAQRWLTAGPGHTGRGAILEYQLDCPAGEACRSAVAAFWMPTKPVAINRKGAISLWIRAGPELRTTLLTRDKDEGLRRYPFDAVTLEHSSAADWRHVVIPLSAKSTGYWDEDHTGKPEGRLSALGILVESRFPQAIHGSISFDEVTLLDSPDQAFELSTNLPVVEPSPGSEQLRPRLGVNIHNLNDEAMLDRARDAGFGFVRADMLWRQVERNGRYRFFAYDRLWNALQKRDMGALWILDYGHPQHGGDPPRTRDDVAAFAQYAEAAATHFKGRKSQFEIWNEPDTARFWPPEPNAKEYSALLAAATTAIHRADPDARVSSGGTSRIDLPFLQAMLASGEPTDWNAVAIHPYRRQPPESFAAEAPVVRQVLARAAREKVQVWDTEWGYASYDYFSRNLRGDGHSAVGRKRQAVLATREALTVWALGLPIAVWYDLRDNGDDPRNPEHNYGLIDFQGAEKPAMKAFRTLARIAESHKFSGMLREVPDGAHAMRLTGAADTVFAVWSDQPDSRITVRISRQGLVSAENFLGEPLKSREHGGGEAEILLAETEGPIYIAFSSR